MANNQKRITPQSLDAEKAVLGCMLINSDSIGDILQHLHPDSFYDKAHRMIFTSMLVLYEKSIPIDSINLIEELKKTKKIKDCGGAYYITGLSQEAPTAANAEYYAKIVKEKETLRAIINTSIEMSTLAYDTQNEVSVILDKAEQHLFGISEKINHK